jgi:drug/metabolite transporter (DMT)-like permease
MQTGRIPLLNTRRSRSRNTALLEGIAAGALFGTAAIFIRLLASMSIFSIAFWRLVIASLFLVFMLAYMKKPVYGRLLKENLLQVLILGVLLGSHFMLFVSAVLDTTILNATVLVNTTPIWSMFVSSLIFKLKPSRVAVLGILISFFGVAIIAYGDASSATFVIHLKGDVEATLAAVVESFYLSYGRDTRRKMPLLNLMFAIYVFSALTVLVGGVLSRSNFNLPAQPNLILALVGLGLLPTAFAHTFYFSSLSHLKSFETATMALLEPVVATLLGIAIFFQVPAILFILGAVFVLVGIISVAIAE